MAMARAVMAPGKDWCQMLFEGVVGYVQAGLVAQVSPEPNDATSGNPCIEARRAGYRKGELLW